MQRRNFLTSLAAGALSAAASRAAAQSAAGRPNIVFMMADDLGYGDLGCYGQAKFATPHIDRLAAEGIRFTQAYAGSTVCSPSRCVLMTGKHTGHCSYRGNMNGEPGIPDSDVTMAEVLKEAGYATGIFGKWGLGNVGMPGYATRQGFDRWYGFLNQGQAHDYYPRYLMSDDVAQGIRENIVYGDKKPGVYAPERIQREALSWLDKQTAERPFFLYLPYTLPHANGEKRRDTGDGMEVPAGHPYEDKPWPAPERGFAGMMHYLDTLVGQITDRLREKGLEKNTLVIFTSDNGPHREGGRQPEFFASSGPLRGIKRDLTEGGIRVPFIARMPGTIPAGRTSEQILAFWDLLPTFAELVKARTPGNLDGQSMLQPLLGNGEISHRPLYWEFHEGGFKQAIRDGKWKAIRKGLKGKVELYDLSADLHEDRDIADAHPDTVRRMETLFQQMRTDSPQFPVKG
ncbi:MAG: arylsulfatase [Bryobacterales bacterium]|nr:arylsulfatase [Bryobacterales bacterium]